ncbi:hypothetical protein [Herbiconiux daphne]|uniref:Uncharacterized protein n=1 Tax=Herbiconiux daphne TaxID=2970914 RepID=A0ABT2H138_9MICO|nr:hypothetical protein [Herbiconiux daphne]MCS5733632.1 hypothetical protein [Herbiconiux daphne]
MAIEDRSPDRFSVREFARTAVGSHRSEIDLAAFAEHPLDPGTVRLLAYLRELERSTMTYLRNVLVTPTHKDARVTAFLTTWAFEKYWIADAFEVIVKAHGYDPTGIQDLSRFRTIALEIAERATPIVESFRANSIGPDIVGVHLASVTVDEWITEAAYTRLAQLDPHPELVSLLERVLEVKKRHRSFVEPETIGRLADSPRAQGLARRSLPKTSWPIGAASLAKSETADFYASLLDGRLAETIDAQVRALPGLASLHLVRDARGSALNGTSGTRARAWGRRVGRAVAGLTHRLAASPRDTNSRDTTPTNPHDTKGGTNG